VLRVGNLDLASPAGKLMLTMLAAVSEMERDLLIERARAGMVRAKAEGKTFGRTPKTTPEQQLKMKSEYANGTGETVSALARNYGVRRATVLSTVKAVQAIRAIRRGS
jgi:putative DNA-invertase from lambdoid prophage Rac